MIPSAMRRSQPSAPPGAGTNSPEAQEVSSGTAVRLSGVSKSFGGTAVLPGLNLDVARGELVTLLGPSGCGKSTTLRMLAGFEHPDAGSIQVDGRDVTGLAAHRRGIGMVFQAYSLFPNLTVAGNIEYGLRLRKADRAERAERTRKLLELCGLPDFAGRYPHELSGGQQQRVALARALATEPSLLLLDEPLSALDASVRATLRTEIRALQQRLHMTMLFVTHDQKEALEISDRVAVMNEGRIEQIASPEEVYERPATPFAARFVGTSNELPVPAGWTGGEVPEDTVGEEIAFVRPEHLRLTPDDDGPATIIEHAYTGERTRVRALFGSRELTASLSSAEAAALALGSRVRLRVDGPIALRLPATEVP